MRCLSRHCADLGRIAGFRHFASDHGSHLHMAGSMCSLLKSRAVVRFRGPDAVSFLQGLVTNDMRGLGEPVGGKRSTLVTPNIPYSTTPPIYTALLTPQGRFLYDMFVHRVPLPHEKLNRTGSGPGPKWDGSLELLVDVDCSVVDEFLETFRKYRLRSKVEIENVAQDFSCWQRFGGSLSKKYSSVEEPDAAAVGWGGAVDLPGVSASQGNGNGWQWFRDPRLECLGFRGIFPSDTTPPLVEADKETDERNFMLWRMENGVAEGTTEIPKGEAIPLEYNLVSMNAISFDKGCYVGQELVARTHHQGVIRKRLLPLKFTDENGNEVSQKVAPGSQVVETGHGKKAGSVTAAIGSQGLGIVRLDAAFRGVPCLEIEGKEGVKVEAFRPEWWPPQW